MMTDVLKKLYLKCFTVKCLQCVLDIFQIQTRPKRYCKKVLLRSLTNWKFLILASFEGWVRRIIVNTAIDSIRKSKRAPILKEKDTDFKVDSTDHIEENETIELTELKASIAMKAIEKLSPGYRTVFNLFVIEEYSHKEIAEILGISEGTSKSNLSKAKFNLKRILTEEFSNLEE